MILPRSSLVEVELTVTRKLAFSTNVGYNNNKEAVMLENRPEQPSSGKNRSFSFWKPEPLPPKDKVILPTELLALGSLASVAERLLEVPNLLPSDNAPWDCTGAALKFVWKVENGVFLRIHTEVGPPRPGEVITIDAKNLN
jgi:hypothetical protein